MFRTVLATLVALFATVAYAHPGAHHGGIFSITPHLLSDPYHLILTIVSIVAGIAGSVYFIRRSR